MKHPFINRQAHFYPLLPCLCRYRNRITQKHLNRSNLYEHWRKSPEIPKQRRNIRVHPVMFPRIIILVNQTLLRISKQWIFLIIGLIRLPAGRQIRPRRHGYDSSRYRHIMIPQIHTECHRQTAARRIADYDDSIGFIAFIAQPFICGNRIF